MTPAYLNLSIRLHDGRFHGMLGRKEDEWPPSPARVFQALVAAASRGERLDEGDRVALRWLEERGAPVVGAPRIVVGQAIEVYVPHNDLDSVGGIPERVAEIRAPKRFSPKIFDAELPLLYAWELSEPSEHADAICRLACGLYQLGRGIDQGWADPVIEGSSAHSRRLAEYPGTLYHPASRGDGAAMSCPAPGTLASLEARHAGALVRISGASHSQRFAQPPKPRFLQVPYNSPAQRIVFDLLRGDRSFAAESMARASTLVEAIRDLAAERLTHALPHQRDLIERYLVGRSAAELDQAPSGSRVRILALPSIGHEHADRGLRRIVVEVPVTCPLDPGDVRWALSGLELYDRATGVVSGVTLTPAEELGMLEHFGFGRSARRWRTVTPVALPNSAKRRRIESARMPEDAKGGAERSIEEARAVEAALQALRYAGVTQAIESLQVQREAFERKGERAEPFGTGTRFEKERLWHVEAKFPSPVTGPMVIGDGRFLGLGLMAPVPADDSVFALAIEDGLEAGADPEDLARALRRAVMARFQTKIGPRRPLPSYVSGHDSDAKTTQAHLSFAFDPGSSRLLVVAPHAADHRSSRDFERDYLVIVRDALEGLDQLRAGRSGLLKTRSVNIDEQQDRLTAAASTWTSVTPYLVTRHSRDGAVNTLKADVIAECVRARLPRPEVETRDVHGVIGVGLVGRVRLRFAVPVRGPILLGRSRFLGGGLFIGAPRGPSRDTSTSRPATR